MNIQVIFINSLWLLGIVMISAFIILIVKGTIELLK